MAERRRRKTRSGAKDKEDSRARMANKTRRMNMKVRRSSLYSLFRRNEWAIIEDRYRQKSWSGENVRLTRAVRDDTSAADEPTFTKLTDAYFTAFQPCSTGEVRKFLSRSPPKSCSLDPVPTFILREFLDELLPFMCNVTLQHGLLPESQKAAIVTPILKKHDLDPDDVKSYRPISNLTFISKVIERIVASQLTGNHQMNRLLLDHQSAYRQGHSTETALLKIFSDILDAADSAQVTLLGLLDLSAAFDTSDHDILLTRLDKS